MADLSSRITVITEVGHATATTLSNIENFVGARDRRTPPGAAHRPGGPEGRSRAGEEGAGRHRQGHGASRRVHEGPDHLISTSVERVELGSSLVDQAGATMGEIVGAIKRVTDIVGAISAASTEQSAGASQAGDAVTLMDKATQQNAALVEQSAAASAAESLKQQAHQTVQAVAVFRLTT